MLTRRLVVCLDVKAGRVVKGTQFVQLRDVGDPVELATRYEAEGADEIVFLDISASAEERGTLLDVGVRSADDVGFALRSGADKVSINSAAVTRPEILTEAAERFGSQCVVASIDAKHDGSTWRVYVKGGREATPHDAVEWAEECVRRGAGEILLTSIDRDGARTGYDLALTRAVSDRVPVPVVASGGAGSAAHVCDVLANAGADAALVAGILHDGLTTVRAVKDAMRAAHLPVRAA
jgi:cyclase